MAEIEIKVPDIGDYADIPVIELCVAVGDTVKVWVEKVDRDRKKISLTMVQGK